MLFQESTRFSFIDTIQIKFEFIEIVIVLNIKNLLSNFDKEVTNIYKSNSLVPLYLRIACTVVFSNAPHNSHGGLSTIFLCHRRCLVFSWPWDIIQNVRELLTRPLTFYKCFKLKFLLTSGLYRISYANLVMNLPFNDGLQYECTSSPILGSQLNPSFNNSTSCWIPWYKTCLLHLN